MKKKKLEIENEENLEEIETDDVLPEKEDDETIIFGSSVDEENYDELDESIEELEEIIVEEPQEIEEVIVEKVVEKQSKKRSNGKKGKQTVKTKTKQSKRNGLIAIGLLLVVSLGLFLSWRFYFSYTTVNPFDIIEIKEIGADGQAYLEIIKPESYETQDDEEIMAKIDFEIHKNENLSKGDKRDIKVLISDDDKKELSNKKIRLKPMKLEYEVGALNEVEEIDVLADLSVETVSEKNSYRIVSVEAQLSDLELKELLAFKLPKNLVKANENYTIEVIETKELDKYLVDHGLKLKRTSIELTLESKERVPENTQEISNLSELEEMAKSQIISDYQAREGNYQNFVTHSVCFTAEPQNKDNAKDANSNQRYEQGSLMFIFSFDLDGEAFADNYGYTNLVLKDGVIDESVMKTIRPKQSNASLDSITKELRNNNFTCSQR
ncbi:hypothetical protein ERUR111494_04905 [Erysipelothrix urinaevulpis]|uniref:hypothetical protein n=1 Tax=Erysipelothrix urinaevulpis TaxID=2683717 RepID=UPI00135A283A|nr:hypothetical protein [Erysipelothrix urinaevulpis]